MSGKGRHIYTPSPCFSSHTKFFLNKKIYFFESCWYVCIKQNTMKTFKDLQFKKQPISDGLAAKMSFENNYGVSVIRLKGSYGFPDLWELAVLYHDKLCCTTPITPDVVGHLTESEVTKIMADVQNLKEK